MSEPLNGDISPDPAIELLAHNLSYYDRTWYWLDPARYQDREFWRNRATRLLARVDALRGLSQTDQNSVTGITTLAPPESG